MPNASPRRTVCNTCGESFPIGWGIMNHLQSSSCVSPAMADGPSEEEDTLAGRDTLTDRGSFNMTEYMDTLADRGTLDPSFVNKYAACGPREVTSDVAEACKFLRCTEVGSGTSRRQAQTFLDYNKSTGGSADTLPKTVEGCWSVVEKVTFLYVYVTFPNICDVVLYLAKMKCDISCNECYILLTCETLYLYNVTFNHSAVHFCTSMLHFGTLRNIAVQ
jgi:hypothetical protein